MIDKCNNKRNKNFIKIFICISILVVPAYAYDDGLATNHEPILDKWLFNMTINNDGLVGMNMQIEINDNGSLPLDGFSFIIQSTIIPNSLRIYNFTHSANIGNIEQQNVPEGTRLIIYFNPKTIGDKWNGSIGFAVENWTIKDNSDYFINIPIDMPQAIISGQDINSNMLTSELDTKISGQMILPDSINIKSVVPKSFKNIHQNGKNVLIWDKLHINDDIVIKVQNQNRQTNMLNRIVDFFNFNFLYNI